MINDPHAIRTESDDVLASVMRAMGLLDDGLRPSSDLIDQVLDVMKGLGIQEVRFTLSGGGDEGDCYLDEIVMVDGGEMKELPAVPVTFTANGSPVTLDSYLESHASEAPDGNWCDNEGGSGTVTYLPFAEQDERIEIDMNWGGDDDYDEDEDLDDVDLAHDEDDEDDDQEDPETAR